MPLKRNDNFQHRSYHENEAWFCNVASPSPMIFASSREILERRSGRRGDPQADRLAARNIADK